MCPASSYTYTSSFFGFVIINIGKSFDVVEIRIPLATALATNMSIVPKVYTDEGSSVKTLATINTTNFTANSRYITFAQPELQDCRCDNNFFLELNFEGTVECPVSLPIRILVDIDDED